MRFRCIIRILGHLLAFTTVPDLDSFGGFIRIFIHDLHAHAIWSAIGGLEEVIGGIQSQVMYRFTPISSMMPHANFIWRKIPLLLSSW